MQRLTVMTLGALAIGLAGYAYDAASAQTSAGMAPAGKMAACPKYESTVYFSHDSAELSTYSNYTIVRIVNDAQACGSKGVVVQSAADDNRAQTVASALRAKGLKAVIVPSPALAQSDEAMINRSVVLRVAAPGTRLS